MGRSRVWVAARAGVADGGVSVGPAPVGMAAVREGRQPGASPWPSQPYCRAAKYPATAASPQPKTSTSRTSKSSRPRAGRPGGLTPPVFQPSQPEVLGAPAPAGLAASAGAPAGCRRPALAARSQRRQGSIGWPQRLQKRAPGRSEFPQLEQFNSGGTASGRGAEAPDKMAPQLATIAGPQAQWLSTFGTGRGRHRQTSAS